MMNNFENIEVSTSVEDVAQVRDDIFWDNQVKNLVTLSNRTSLQFAEALYYINKGKGYKTLGFESLGQYVYERHGRGQSWADGLVRIWDVCVIECGKNLEDLVKVGHGKLQAIVAQLTPQNIDQWFEDAQSMKKTEIEERISGEPEEIEVTNPDTGLIEKEKYLKVSFKVSELVKDSIDSAVMTAKMVLAKMGTFGNSADQISDAKAIEFIANNFVTVADDDGCPAVTLDRACSQIRMAYGVDLNPTPIEESD